MSMLPTKVRKPSSTVPTFLAMYYNLLETLVTRQLILGQSAVVDCLVNDEIATRWQQLGPSTR